MEFSNIEITNLDGKNQSEAERILFIFSDEASYLFISFDTAETNHSWKVNPHFSSFTRLLTHKRNNIHPIRQHKYHLLLIFTAEHTVDYQNQSVYWAHVKNDAELLHDAIQKQGIRWCFWITFSSSRFASIPVLSVFCDDDIWLLFFSNAWFNKYLSMAHYIVFAHNLMQFFCYVLLFFKFLFWSRSYWHSRWWSWKIFSSQTTTWACTSLGATYAQTHAHRMSTTRLGTSDFYSQIRPSTTQRTWLNSVNSSSQAQLKTQASFN